MPITPEYELKDYFRSALQKYGDPVDALKIFNSNFLESRNTKCNVLVFYGLDKKGENELLRQFQDCIESADLDNMNIVLELSPRTCWDTGQELLRLHDSLHQFHGLSFPAFDIAYGIYWLKNNLGLLLRSENLSIPNTSCSFLSCLAAGLNEDNSVNWDRIITRTLQDLPNTRDQQKLKFLYSLPGMEAVHVLRWLPAFLTDDIKAFFNSGLPSMSIMVKGYEKLFADAPSPSYLMERDQWLRELIAHLPEINWVILSSIKIPWEEHYPDWKTRLSQHLVGNLNELDVRSHLISQGITKKEYQDEIIKACHGIPFYLDLAAACPFRLEQYAENPLSSILDEYIRSLNKAELRTFKIMSCSPIWEEEILDRLLIRSSSRFSQLDIDDLEQFPFIFPGDLPGTISMHEIMRDKLLNHYSNELDMNVNEFLYEHYSSLLPVSENTEINHHHRMAFEQCCYHGRLILSPIDFLKWFTMYSGIFFELKEYEFLLPHLQNTLPLLEQTPEQSEIYVLYLKRLAACYIARGNYEEAENILRNILEISQKAPLSSDILDALIQLGTVCKKQGRSREAAFCYKQALNSCKQIYGHDNPLTAAALHNLAVLYKSNSQLEEAEPLFLQALDIMEKTLGPCHTKTLTTLNQLEALYELQGKRDKQISLYQRELYLRQESLGPDSIAVAEMQANLAVGLLLDGKYADADPLLIKAYDIGSKKLYPNHPMMNAMFTNIAALYQILGKFDILDQVYYERLLQLSENPGPAHPDTSSFLAALAGLYHSRGKYVKLIYIYEQFLEKREKCPEPIGTDTVAVLNNLGILLKAQKRYEKAEIYFKQALDIIKSFPLPNHSSTIAIVNNLAGLYEMQNKFDEAEVYHVRALRMARRFLGKDHQDTYRIAQKLENLQDKIHSK